MYSVHTILVIVVSLLWSKPGPMSGIRRRTWRRFRSHTLMIWYCLILTLLILWWWGLVSHCLSTWSFHLLQNCWMNRAAYSSLVVWTARIKHEIKNRVRGGREEGREGKRESLPGLSGNTVSNIFFGQFGKTLCSFDLRPVLQPTPTKTQ